MNIEQKTREQLVNELDVQSKYIKDLETAKKTLMQLEQALSRERDRFQKYLEIAGFIFVVINRDQTVAMINKKGCEVLGYEESEIVGKNWFDMFIPQTIRDDVKKILGKIIIGEVKQAEYAEGCVVTKDGGERLIAWHNSVLRDDDGKIVTSLSSGEDITDRKQLETELHAKVQEIMDLSIPIMQIWEGVLVVPLIGTLDSKRALQFTERVLERIVETDSSVVLIDITGVPAVDTQTAQHLIETFTAIRLLGARTVLTGVRSAIAQTLVHLGIDLSDILTRSSLIDGLKVALGLLENNGIALDRNINNSTGSKGECDEKRE